MYISTVLIHKRTHIDRNLVTSSDTRVHNSLRVHSIFQHFYTHTHTLTHRPVHQEDLVTNLRQALTHHTIPEITQTILNLAEFMEHCEEATVCPVYSI